MGVEGEVAILQGRTVSRYYLAAGDTVAIFRKQGKKPLPSFKPFGRARGKKERQ
jgi:hypothetical protein